MKADLPRRDRCHLIGRRAKRLSPAQSAAAWQFVANEFEGWGDLTSPRFMNLPKFNHVLNAIRQATIQARQTP